MVPQREEFLAESMSSIMKASSNSNGRAGSLGDDDGGIDAFDAYGSDGGYSSDGGGGGGGDGGYGDYGDLSDGGGDGYNEGGGEGDGAGVAPISLEDAFRDKPQTYEDLCRSHIVSGQQRSVVSSC